MEKKYKSITLGSTEVWLLSDCAMYIPFDESLIIADWHLGKTAHFRKFGIFVPKTSLDKEFEQLVTLVATYPVQRVIFLGDLFHSEWNMDWDLFLDALDQFFDIEFVLTLGNHDILDFQQYEMEHLKIVKKFEVNSDIVLSHQPLKRVPENQYNIVGHVHPGIELRTKSKQSFRLPCFYIKDKVVTLPAFGAMTGLYILDKADADACYAIMGTEVFMVPK